MRNKTLWHLASSPSDANITSLTTALDVSLLIARLLVQRGYDTPASARAFLSSAAYTPTPPDALPDLVLTAARLQEAISGDIPILVWGDFDVDGQTATALLVSGLRALGANVEFYIPHRLRESHGIRIESLRQQLRRHDPGILLTCDTGISAHDAIDYAKSKRVTVLITDHHDLPPTLPNADAAVDPKRLSAEHPLATLPGVGVAYKLLEYLYTAARRAEELDQFLDLVALGIVADVAEQTRDTRYLLQRGMSVLQHTQRPGLRALIETAQLNPELLTAEDIAFQLAPRLNAAGRLADARPVVDLFTTQDDTQARILALQLEQLNNQRRLQNRQIYTAAQEQIARDPSLLDWEALVLSHPAWHAGIIGIVASRLAEQYHRPVVLLSVDDNGHARGSARSVPGYDIGAAIAAQDDLLIEYGGHPGAAGLSLREIDIPAFRRRLAQTLHETRDPDARPGLFIDAEIDLADTGLNLAHDLRQLAPFGEGNPQVTFITRDLTLASAALIGRTREHRRLTVQDAAGNRRSVLWWNSADQAPPDDLFDLAYQVSISTYKGQQDLQLTLVDWRRSESAPIPVEHPQRTITDHRTDPDSVLADLPAYPDAAIWAEGFRRAESPGLPLHELPEASTLIVYTAPAGPQRLQEALERTQAYHIVLLGIMPPFHVFADIQRRLLELVKYVLNQQGGRTTLDDLAGTLAQSLAAVRLGLDTIAAHGEITVTYGRSGNVTLAPGNGAPYPDAADYLAAFQASVAETAAYRAFFHRAAPAHILGEQSDA